MRSTVSSSPSNCARSAPSPVRWCSSPWAATPPRRPASPRCGSSLNGVEGAFAVSRFVEKPDAATAARYVASGEYFWNSGIFLFPAALYLAEIERLRPDMLAACQKALAGERAETDFIRLDKAAFA